MQSPTIFRCAGRSFKRDQLFLLVQKRYRYKKKWAVNLPPKTYCERALDHFDAFYKPVFGENWPSLRVSLLSLPKYAAIVNNFGDADNTVQQLVRLRAVDMIDSCIKRVTESNSRLLANTHVYREEPLANDSSISKAEESYHGDDLTAVDYKVKEPSAHGCEDNKAEETRNSDIQTMQNVFTPGAVHNNTDLQYFIPTQTVYTEKEMLLLEEEKCSTFLERPISVRILPERLPALSKHLKIMTFTPGDVSDFPSPKSNDINLLNYYLLDGGSVLPVLALEVQPGNSVLDLCAGPGGKSLAILQLLMSQGGHLTANDNSGARIHRMQSVLRSYISKDLLEKLVHVQQKDARLYRDPVYDKVLVDVPCNSDRHVLTEEDNNLFKPGRIEERLQLTTVQKELLMAGIRSCKPGGSIVYSTCTLAPGQNDGVVQAAVEELWETSDIDVVVENLSPLATLLKPFFKFHKGTRLGQLVLPSLLNNFGPTYFCKLNRLK